MRRPADPCVRAVRARADAAPALMEIPGVIRVAPSEERGSPGALEIETERGADIRREIARTIVNRGWGLLELRPMRMSLEEVFLQVTTEERPAESSEISGPSTDPGSPVGVAHE